MKIHDILSVDGPLEHSQCCLDIIFVPVSLWVPLRRIQGKKRGTAMLFLMIPRVIGHIRIPQLVKKVYPLHPSITGPNYERALKNVLKRSIQALALAP